MTDAVNHKQIKIRVLFFGAAKDLVGAGTVDLSLNFPATTASAFEKLVARFPDLKRFGRSLLIAVNQEYANADQDLQDNDELAVFPPVSGGAEPETKRLGDEAAREEMAQNSAGDLQDSTRDFFEITSAAIDVGAIARRVVLPECGATVTLDGYAREWTTGKRTDYLVYEAYETMAVAELARLGREAHKRFAIAHIGIVHRTGRLEIGETSVVIAVSAPHRGAAFEACEWAIRELKRTVPIWKKEVFEDGEVWVESEGSPPKGTEGTEIKRIKSV
jgi:molybdopterin converting factor subunit 1